METKSILKTAVGLGALSLVVKSSKLLKKPSPKKLIKGAVGITLGTALLTPISELVK